MPGLIPIYRKSSDNAITTYSFTDLASGNGFIQYYGLKDQSGYRLVTSTAIRSSQVMTRVISNASTDTIQHDLDFDLKFNVSQTIQGKCYVSVPALFFDTAGGGMSMSAYVKIYIRKYDGTTETEIANGTSPTLTTYAMGISATVKGQFSASIDVTTPTVIGVGETLRVTVEFHAWNAGGGNMNISIGHDPANRATDLYEQDNSSPQTFGSDPTTLIALISLRVDN